MEFTASWLAAVLKKNNFCSEDVVKIDEIEKTKALESGENYLSVISRLTAKLWLRSGRDKKCSLIIKEQHESPQMKKMSESNGFFIREIVMYQDILPKMEALMYKFQDREEPLWSKCYYVKENDLIVLEDLNASGYSMAERRKQLVFNTVLFVIKKLAKFHALSSVLNERLEIPDQLFGKHFLSENDEERTMYKQSLYKLAESMDDWGDEWKDAKTKLLNSLPSYWAKIDDYIMSSSDGFTVLNHGDCWTNNMLFRYDLDSSPTWMKFVDFQLSHLGTPAHDLHWFLSTSVTPETRTAHLEEFLNVYSQSLANNLKTFSYTGEIPSTKDITAAFDKTRFLSLWFATMLIPGVLADKAEAYDVESLMQQKEEFKGKGDTVLPFNVFVDLPARSKNVLKYEIREAMKNGVI